jgi:arabinan endo-1,5-alpha-L-arabinosidase
MRKIIGSCFVILTCIMLQGCAKESFDNIPVVSQTDYDIEWKDASVHDPSIVEDNGTYYIFGSHLAAAKSTDLMNWSMISSKVSNNNPLIPEVFTEMKEAFVWAQTATFWAPDVIKLEDGRYYMYYCNCEGSKPLGCIGIAVADNIEGPYHNLGLILKSGMTDIPSEDGDVYDATKDPNAVDPCVFYDAEERLWMMYGSYSGGIFILELDRKTGFPLEEGYGKKLLGGNHLRIEGSYVQYNPQTQYYYMFLSYGGLAADGGYNIRVCRSKQPDGPYYDTTGADMIDCSGADGSFFDDKAAEKYGAKLMGNYKWLWQEGENGEKRRGIISPGHNSILYQEETGKYFVIFHSRFEGLGESHKVRVHQILFNEEGWPVIAPYRYSGESIGSYDKDEVAGSYKLINHGHDISDQMVESDQITLYSNGKVEGDTIGTWKLKGDNDITIKLEDKTYKGKLIKEYDEFGEKYVMTFTALSEDGVAVWGSGLASVEP